MAIPLKITGISYTVDEKTRKYVIRKIGRLEKYLPKHARKSATIDVKLRQVNRKNGNKYEAEIVFGVPEKTLTARGSTVNMLAVIDIVEAKLVTQLRKYKQTSIMYVGRRRVLGRLKERFRREE